MTEIIYTLRANKVMAVATTYCETYRHEFLTPEHIIYALLDSMEFQTAFERFEDTAALTVAIGRYLDSLEKVPDGMDYRLDLSVATDQFLNIMLHNVEFSGVERVDITHVVHALLNTPDAWGATVMKELLGENEGEFMGELISLCEAGSDSPFDDDDPTPDNDESAPAPRNAEKGGDWKAMVVCMNDSVGARNPLIGRGEELQRTIQVLCRRDKNNPLHVGEPGVGKTALVWGLVRRIEEGDVPERLRGSKVYMMDMSSMIAGTQFRGDFEKRIKEVLESIKKEGDGNIVYIDEIHTLVGAGATGEGAMDASNILKPYLEDGSIRFIGSTTYEEFNRYFSRSKGLLRRFQQIDIEEPSVEEAKNILRQLQPHYEEFHHVSFTPDAVDFAVEASARHINERFLPDKAIDLVDEAGAAMQMAPEKKDIGIKEIADVLSKIAKVDALAQAEDDDMTRLEHLSDNMRARIFGQDQAVREVVEAVQMSRAGLNDDSKPLASLLFVGPTGVGKTEVARVLAKELGMTLHRFDMSEYVEKHSVAKLIGSPAGYVGYEDGGQLTDAIRKTPNCVLLLDEIEKAHEDIYNILLQVMDYGKLTDNKGRKADFRNVILIMTSNAGARYASRASVGFAGKVSRGQAMMQQVKKTFKPEFLNRLSGTVVFNDMDHAMASLILKKKIGELEDKLRAKNVEMEIAPDAFEFLLSEGFTPEYGAREMDRVIAGRLKPLLMRELLFGALKSGGKATVELENGSLKLQAPKLLK